MAMGLGIGALGSGNTFVKYFLFISNLIFFLVGGGLIGVGIYLLNELLKVSDAVGDQAFVIGLPAGIITLGLFIFIGSAFGCIGALRESTCMIKSFLGFLVVTLILELVITGFVIAYNTDGTTQDAIDNLMKQPFEECTNGPKSKTVACTWLPEVQSWLKCCGYTKEKNPIAGWKDECGGDSGQRLAASYAATQYCNKAIVEYVSSNMVYVASILGALLFVEVLLVIGTCFLIQGIKEDNQYK